MAKWIYNVVLTEIREHIDLLTMDASALPNPKINIGYASNRR